MICHIGTYDKYKHSGFGVLHDAFNDSEESPMLERSGVASNGFVGCANPRALAEPG